MGAAVSPPAAVYRVAGRSVVLSPPLPELAPFALDRVPAPPTSAPAVAASAVPVHRGTIRLGEHLIDLACFRGATGFRLAVKGVGEFLVAADGTRVVRTKDLGAPAPLLTEATLGPALLLALALQGIWCLHAGAAAFDGRAIALVGHSGAGKTTLADALGRRGGRWRPLIDDLLPASLDGGKPTALPRFPQPRRAADLPAPPEPPARLGLAAIYLLAPPPPSAAPPVAVDRVAPRDAALALVHHTFASCLFDGERQARHLAFCADLAAWLPVKSLVYPRRLDVLDDVGDALEDDLGRGGATLPRPGTG